MQESFPLHHAIAPLAYGDDRIARHYKADPGVRTSGHRQRRSDRLCPTESRLPGTEVSHGIVDETQLANPVRNWASQDTVRWADAKGRLWQSAQVDAVPAFGDQGTPGRDFWLTHSVDSPEVQMFRFRRSDLERLIVSVAEKRNTEPQSAPERILAVLPRHRAPPPTSDLMTACEVLTWIAFGESLTLRRLGAYDALMLDMWGTDQLDDLVVALEARAAEQPFTPLAGALRKPWFNDRYIGQSWAESMRAIRTRARRRQGRLVSFADLRDQLARERDSSANGDKLMAMASAQLRGALAASRLTAFGRRHEGMEHEPIKATVFMDLSISINWWDTVESESHGRWFEDVQFKTAEVLTVWPAASEPELPLAPRQGTETLSASQPIKPEIRAGTRTNSVRKERRGRRPKYNWGRIIISLGAKLAVDGLPMPGDGGQAKLEAWVRDQFPVDSCPAESVIRDKVAATIAAHRLELEGEAGI